LTSRRQSEIFEVFLAATLDRGRAYWWRPRGMSMAPAIHDGDRVLVAPVTASALRLGDVVKFWLGGGFCLHRLVRRGGAPAWFEFQGDRLRRRDPRVGPEAIIGVAVAVEHDGRVWRLDSRLARLRGLGRVVLMRLGSDEGGTWSRRYAGRGGWP
jgi:signal peptidase I